MTLLACLAAAGCVYGLGVYLWARFGTECDEFGRERSPYTWPCHLFDAVMWLAVCAVVGPFMWAKEAGLAARSADDQANEAGKGEER